MSTWFSPEGLMHLNPHEEDRTVDNDNGILFRCFYLVLKQMRLPLTQADLDESFRAIKAIEVEPGLYARNQLKNTMEAHDNYVGLCGLSVLHDFTTARDIVEYGTKTGFNYNNLEPGKPLMRTTRQGGDIAFYKLCAGYMPTLWNLAWLLIGILLAAFSKKPSVVNLAWLRVKILELVVKKNKIANWELLVKPVVVFMILFFNIVLSMRGGIEAFFAQYYREDHPIRLMGRGMYDT